MRRLLPIALWLVAVKEVAGEGKCGYAADQITCAAAEMCRHETGEGKDEPRCDVYCSTVTACNQHATSVRYVADASCKEPYYHENGVCETYGDCDCDCTEQYKGMCDECNDGYTASAYPACGAVCTDEKSCSGHSSSVTWSTGDKCTCVCENQWSGSTCKDCLSPFGGTDCDACLEGRISYPTCTACSKETHCSSHAESVNDDGTRTTCVCKCENHWEGTKCQTCPSPFGGSSCSDCAEGRITYPTCTECTSAAHCSGHAKTVTDDGTRKSCVCSCATGYTGPACDKCSEDYIGYPNCRKCTSETDCNGHAKSVTDDGSRLTCVCTCANKWLGSTCNNCPAPYAGDSCSTCLANYIDYPTCTECTVKDSCSDHATAVVDDGTRSSCKCTCTNKWSGGDCGTCPGRWTGADCDKCSANHITYPSCVQCTSAKHCSGHADTVTDDGMRKSCLCECKNQWQGDTCDVCPTKYGGSDCNDCAAGYVGYPTCTKCTEETHCSDHAKSVTDDGKRKECVCTCRNQWDGPTCNVCDSIYGGSDCNACVSGRVNYPTCTACNDKEACSNHADSVATDTVNDQCVCVCADQWGSADCSTCAAKYETTTCDACAKHYITYPQCTRCTSKDHCNDHASSATDDGTRTSCKCTCSGAYEGPTCNKCSEGHIEYPSCTQCTSASHCNEHASSATDDGTRTSCSCKCSNKWSGSTCKDCLSPYGGTKCNKCAENRIDYPTCTLCEVGIHCSGHADSVEDDSSQSACVCKCKSPWTGPTCSECPSKYNGTACNRCAENRIDYPLCTLCTTTSSCSGHAGSVAADAAGENCVCACRNQWTGSTCDTCEPRFANDCGECAANHTKPFPACASCSIATSCSGHATSVNDDGTRTSCVCKCSNQWTGDSCETCPSKYSGTDCDKCASGGVSYPTCGSCTFAESCSGHAEKVETDASQTKCVCTCENQWEGDKCQTCPTKFGGSDCNTCAVRHIGYPQCTQCSTSKHCSGHADSVTDNGNRTTCVCSCSNQWTSDDCGECPDMFVGADCNKCAADRIEYPKCTQCDSSTHCSGHATQVTDDGTRDHCVCQCENAWSGLQCETCDSNFDGVNCDKCAEGHIGYPTCTKCTVDAFCLGNAESVTDDGNRSSCVCKCENQWTKDDCSVCPPAYGGAHCGKCAVNHIDYPTCTECTVAQHCSGRAKAVTDDGSRAACVCVCENMWSGSECDECPYPHAGTECNECAVGTIDYPTCTVCNESVHCNGHGSSATDNGNRTSCVCKCKGNWVGDHCGTCPMQFEGANCDSCALGRIGYPTCTRCDEDQHCSGHALSVTDDGDRKLCVCNCSEKWTGSSCNTCEAKYDQNTCDRCADGHVGFPDCRQCSSSDCNGHEANVTSNAAKTECVCNCANQWTGDTCDVCEASKYAGDDCNRCAVGHTNYPLCGDACHVDYNCSGNADSVTFDATGGTCSCMCMGSWSGDACDICDAKYNQVGCDFCADGFIAYPNCTECTNSEHCNDRASTVASKASGDQCMCTCRDFWEGETCESCPMKYDAATCKQCAADYMGVAPDCKLCSTATHCNGRASSVHGTADQCECDCTNGWSGDTCAVCDPTRYSGDDCEACAPGRMMFPLCKPSCTVNNNCTHATSVDWVSQNDTCACACMNMWEGPACDVCPSRFNQTSCDSCEVGHINYPHCLMCSVSEHCSGNAVNVTDDGSRSSCKCTCDNQWDGTMCDVCPAMFYGPDCDACAEGFVKYPTCGLCTSADCSFHAKAFFPNVDSCDCSCADNWEGDTCNICPLPYSGPGCNTCADGFFDYPDCRPCSVDLNCSGNANSVRFAADSCSCDCIGDWDGPSCDVCKPPHAGEFCDQCAADAVLGEIEGQQFCRSCSLGTDCTSAAARVAVVDNICVCLCPNSWVGELCNICPEEYDEDLDCGACRGDEEYPRCKTGPSETLTLTLTLTIDEREAFGASSIEDDTCWTLFEGYCFWLVFLGCVLVLACIIAIIAFVVIRQARNRKDVALISDSFPACGDTPDAADVYAFGALHNEGLPMTNMTTTMTSVVEEPLLDDEILGNRHAV